MRYAKLLTDKHALALTAIMLLGLACIMATSEVTLMLVAVKAIGFALIYVYCRLFKKWDSEGKVDVIKELFNDNEEEAEV